LTITDWNQLSEGEIGALTGNTHSFRKRVRKEITSESEVDKSEVKVLARKLK
jgi:hypothetical protein